MRERVVHGVLEPPNSPLHRTRRRSLARRPSRLFPRDAARRAAGAQRRRAGEWSSVVPTRTFSARSVVVRSSLCASGLGEGARSRPGGALAQRHAKASATISAAEIHAACTFHGAPRPTASLADFARRE